MRRGSAMVLASSALVAVCAGIPRASAAPIVSIQARTEVEIDPIRRTGTGTVIVRGRVIDRASREGVRAVRITIQLDDTTRGERTDADGEFRSEFAVPDGKHNLRIDFVGTSQYTASFYEIRDFDVDKEPLELAVEAERVVDYAGKSTKVVVKASRDRLGVAIAVALYLGPDGAKNLESIGTVQTDATGRGTLDVPLGKLGKPGRKRLEARFAGNEGFDPATAHTTLTVVTKSKVSFTPTSTTIAHESRLRGSGAVTDTGGAPIPRAPVALLVGSRRMSEVLTGEDGSFEFTVSAAEIGVGKFNVQAVFEPTKSWRRADRSEPVLIEIAEPKPVPIRYTIAAFGLTALAMLAFFALRSRPWEAWLARLRRHDADDDQRRVPKGANDSDSQPVHTGLQHARPGLVSTLRRANDFGFTGTVRHAIRHRPVANARVRLEHDDTSTCESVTLGDGTFELADLAPGEWSAQVSCHGYCTERFHVTIPHRGELRGARVDLLPVREKVFSMYRVVAEPLLPRPKLWGVWTPRQIFEHVRQGRPASSLSELTDFVEEIYFSQRTPGEDALMDAAALLDAASDEASL